MRRYITHIIACSFLAISEKATHAADQSKAPHFPVGRTITAEIDAMVGSFNREANHEAGTASQTLRQSDKTLAIRHFPGQLKVMRGLLSNIEQYKIGVQKPTQEMETSREILQLVRRRMLSEVWQNNALLTDEAVYRDIPISILPVNEIPNAGFNSRPVELFRITIKSKEGQMQLNDVWGCCFIIFHAATLTAPTDGDMHTSIVNALRRNFSSPDPRFDMSPARRDRDSRREIFDYFDEPDKLVKTGSLVSGMLYRKGWGIEQNPDLKSHFVLRWSGMGGRGLSLSVGIPIVSNGSYTFLSFCEETRSKSERPDLW